MTDRIQLPSGEIIQLNPFLLHKNKVTESQLERLGQLYKDKAQIIEDMFWHKTPNTMMGLVDKLEKLEFELQMNWNFPLDRKYHSYWYKVPFCKCSVEDNARVYGIGIRYENPLCPLHGSVKKIDL